MTDININKITQGIAKIIEDGEIDGSEAGELFSLVKESTPLFKKQQTSKYEFDYQVEEQDLFVRNVNKELVLLGSDARLKWIELAKDVEDNKKQIDYLPDGGFALGIGFIVGSPTQLCLPYESMTSFFDKGGSYITTSRLTRIFAKGNPDDCWF